MAEEVHAFSELAEHEYNEAFLRQMRLKAMEHRVPSVGDIVHVWHVATGSCHPAIVTEPGAFEGDEDGLAVIAPGATKVEPLSLRHQESRVSVVDTWHWPEFQ